MALFFMTNVDQPLMDASLVAIDDILDDRPIEAVVEGGDGDDRLYGGAPGPDTLYGGAGNDTLYSYRQGEDVFYGGAGIDTAYLRFTEVRKSIPNNVVIELSDGVWNVSVNGASHVELFGMERLDVFTGKGNDSVQGGSMNDMINVERGDDTVRAGAGDDVVWKSFGTYDLDGGSGHDTLIITDPAYGVAGQAVYFDARNAVGTISSGTVTRGTFRNFEEFQITGSRRNDVFYLSDGNDRAAGGYGSDFIHGGGGNDFIYGGSGPDFNIGILGNDTLIGGTGNDTIYISPDEGNFAGRVFGADGDDLVEVLSFNDFVEIDNAIFNGGAGYDTLRFDDDIDNIDLSVADVSGFEVLETTMQGTLTISVKQFRQFDTVNADNAELRLTTRQDLVLIENMSFGVIWLADGGQRLDVSQTTAPPGSSLAPTYFGGNGGDTIIGAVRSELIDGRAGNERIEGRGGQDTIKGGQGNDLLIGGDMADSLYGGLGNDTLRGNGGNDLLLGLEGNDTLTGGDGDDSLWGGEGADYLLGQAGADVFAFSNTLDSPPVARDTILDFTINPADGAGFVDRIDLSAIDASVTAQLDQAFIFIGFAEFTPDTEGEIRVVKVGNHTVLEINTNLLAGPDMTILLRDVQANLLGASDFIL